MNTATTIRRACSGIVAILLALSAIHPSQAQSRPVDQKILAKIDAVVKTGLEQKRMPGCVVLVGRGREILYRKAFGFRQLKPEKKPATVDTIYDLASLTKPIATATSILKLVEANQLKLNDTVAKHWKAFGNNGKSEITLEQLLLHTGGLIADNHLRDYQGTTEQSMQKIANLGLVAKPGTRFIYSDVGYIVLAEIVRRVSGDSVDRFAAENIFSKCSMKQTGYNPPASWYSRCAPTERRASQWMLGQVHDPRAYRLGGVAGHAGLFSTVDDLAKFAQMMLSGGSCDGRQVLRSSTIEQMIKPKSVPRGLRAAGWDIRSPYSSNRGTRFSVRAFGHGGFTGTAIWMDPETKLFVIFLSNRLHPDGKGSVNSLIGEICTLAASAIAGPAGNVLTGIDVLRNNQFDILRGKRVGLITNRTGIDREGRSTIDILAKSERFELVKLFAPEHGLRSDQEGKINDTKDEKTGLPILSLYGSVRAPTKQQLNGLDVIVFDIQDIGTRYYTYISTMGLAMQSAAENGLGFVVLDRPNPIHGEIVEGPVMDSGSQSFVGFHTIAMRHGMTAGELAQMFQAELKLDLNLQVVKVSGWQRQQYFDETGLPWINPSPNIRNLSQALLYPCIGFLETTNLSVGRGTDEPFEKLGAPWIDGKRLARKLNAMDLPGIQLMPIEFTPKSSKHAGQRCGGIQLAITDRKAFAAFRTGLQIALVLREMYPQHWDRKSLGRLLGNRRLKTAIDSGQSFEKTLQQIQKELRSFQQRRQKYLLY